ncbi:hypothetical protein DBB34_11615 [Sphaerisporangium cinnabarinum]|nr:hypothetical protein [Sphaerisporangium cinnabarinum]PTU56021.1 hypothetical protein DBB34_11615 [Sphaerisporangium cinnabarinum]
MNSDLLDHLAHLDGAVPVPSLARIEDRARQIRRARVARRGVAAGGLAGAMTMALVLLPAVGPDATGGRPAVFLGVAAAAEGADARDCRAGEGLYPDRTSWAGDSAVTRAVAVLDGASEPVVAAGAYEFRGECPPVRPVAVLLDDDPQAGVTVWSDVADPYSGEEGLVTVAVRGADGALLEQAGGAVLTWEVGGTRWLAEGSGLTSHELVEVLDRLTFGADGDVDPASVPVGLASVDLPPRTDDVSVIEWTTFYGDVEEGGVALTVTAAPVEPAEAVASRAADAVVLARVGDARAVYHAFGPRGEEVAGVLQWRSGGLTYRVHGPADVDQLVALARTVRHVDLAAPELAGVPTVLERSGSPTDGATAGDTPTPAPSSTPGSAGTLDPQGVPESQDGTEG